MKPLSLSRPYLIIMVGIPGAGKSFFAEHFGETFRAPVINLGKIQTELFGGINDDPREEELAEKVVQMTFTELSKTGATIVYDGPTESRTKRQEIVQFARSIHYEPLLVWVQTDSGEAARRSTSTRKSDGFLTDDQFEQAVRRFSIPAPEERAIVISGKHTYASQLKIVLKYLASNRNTTVTQTPKPRPAAATTRRRFIQ